MVGGFRKAEPFSPQQGWGDCLVWSGAVIMATPIPYPSPDTLLGEVYGKTTGRREFDPYLSDWTKSIQDDRGRVRLHKARCAFLQGSFDFGDLKEAYRMWVGLAEFGKINVSKNGELLETRISQLPKRGNNLYRWKLKKRLGFLDSLANRGIPKEVAWLHRMVCRNPIINADFFDPKEFDKSIGDWDTVSRPSPDTKMLFVTLTWDPKSCDLETAWSGRKVERIVGLPPNGNPYQLGVPKEVAWLHRMVCRNPKINPPNYGDTYTSHSPNCPCVSCRWNRFISAMRKRYGRIKVFRTFEAFGEKPQDGKVHADGYPHVHAVLYFEDYGFTVAEYTTDDDGNKHFRIPRPDRDSIANLWGFHSNIEACYSVSGAIGYLKKYMLKTYGDTTVKNVHRIDSEKAELTVSLLWLFKKQSFAVSGGWSSYLITCGVIQTDSDGYSEFEFEWVGVFSASELGIDPNTWSMVIPAG